MTMANPTLQNLAQALTACEHGQSSTAQLVQHWRTHAAPLPLPARYADVLNGLLDRMESSALFSEESCSFSQKDQLQSLHVWLDKARQQLDTPNASKPG